MHFSIDRTVHTTAFDKPVVDHWLELKIATKKRPLVACVQSESLQQCIYSVTKIKQK